MTKPAFGGYLFTGSATTGMPDATVSGRIGNFIFIGLAGTTFENPYSVQWCAIDDAQDWPTIGSTDARTKQSGKEPLSAEYGKVTGITDGDFYGYVFQQRAITRVQYIGGDVVFSFETFEKDRGCIDYNRFAQVDDLIVFQSEKGYHTMQDNQIADVGAGVVDKSFRPQSNQSGIRSVAKNPALEIVVFDDSTYTGGSGDSEGLIYNYKTNQFSSDTVLQTGGIYCVYDVNDADKIIGMARQLSNVVDFRDGEGDTPMAAKVETAFYSDDEDRLLMVDSARIIPYGVTWDVRVKSIDWPVSTVPAISVGTVNSTTSRHYFRKTGAQQPQARYVSLTVETAAGTSFDRLSRAEVDVKPGGRK